MTGPDRCTAEEYLAIERHAEFRSEYIDGQIIAMAQGESRPRNPKPARAEFPVSAG